MMKFTVSSTSLLTAVTVAGRTVNKKNFLPILNYFLFDLNGGKLTVTASDTKTTIVCEVDVDSTDFGRVAIDATHLSNVLKTFSGEPLTFNIDSEFKTCNVSWNTGEFTVPCISGDTYPMTPQSESEQTIVIVKSSMLLDAIKDTSYCVSRDTLRPQMCNLYVKIDTDSITFAATNRYSLAEHIIRCKNDAECECTIPLDAINVLSSLLPNKDIDVTIVIDPKNARFSFGNMVIICRLSDDKFVEYKRLLSKNQPNNIVVDANILENAVKRCGVFSDVETGLIVCNFNKGNISIHSEDINFARSATENVLAEYDGTDDVILCFQTQYMLELLSHIKSDKVNIRFFNNTQAGTFCNVDETADTVTFLLMPMSMPVIATQESNK